MNAYDVHKGLYLNCEIYGPRSEVQALGRGQYGHIVKMHWSIFPTITVVEIKLALLSCLYMKCPDIMKFYRPSHETEVEANIIDGRQIWLYTKYVH